MAKTTRSEPPPANRTSNGLEQFFASIQGQSHLRILDLAGASQANIGVITSMGHQLYSDGFLRTMETIFGTGADFYENQSDPARLEMFLRQTLEFPPAHFDGALVWDNLQFLTPPLLAVTIERLRYILQSSAHLFALFHAEDKSGNVPAYSYRIVDQKTLSLTSKGSIKPAQFFNNRSLEKLFSEFQAVKFFLTRDNLREVIVRR